MRTARNYCFHYATAEQTKRRFHFSSAELEKTLAAEIATQTCVALSAYCEQRNELSERNFSVSFDDAHRSVLTEAAPVLRAIGVPATLFVPTNYVGTPGFLSWSELEELRSLGWEIGAHTKSHPRMSRRIGEWV